MAKRRLIPDVCEAKRFFVECQHIHLQGSLVPPTSERLFSCVFVEMGLTEMLVKHDGIGIGDNFSNHIHVVRTLNRSAGLVRNQQPQGDEANEDDLLEKRGELVNRVFLERQVRIRHGSPCRAVGLRGFAWRICCATGRAARSQWSHSRELIERSLA
jgi:hypothetical protein